MWSRSKRHGSADLVAGTQSLPRFAQAAVRPICRCRIGLSLDRRWVRLAYAAVGWALRGHALGCRSSATSACCCRRSRSARSSLQAPRSWAGCQRLFWDTFAIGVGLWIIGHLGWAFEDRAPAAQSWLQWHTAVQPVRRHRSADCALCPAASPGSAATRSARRRSSLGQLRPARGLHLLVLRAVAEPACPGATDARPCS